MENGLNVASLRDAIMAIVEAPTAHRNVTVTGVHVAQAGALLAVLRFQAPTWHVENIGRVTELASLEALLRAIATDLIPILLDDPTSLPSLGLLDRYSRYIKASASAVGGIFVEFATRICDQLVAHAATGSRRPLLVTPPEMIARTNDMLRRIHDFRSSAFAIAVSDIDEIDTDDSDTDDSATDEEVATDFSITSLREALQEIVVAPAARRRVTVRGIHVSHASALLSVIDFQASACSWEVLNITRLAKLAKLDSDLEAIADGVLRILVADPTCPAALTLLSDYAGHIKEGASRVGGMFEELATAVCDSFIEHAATPSNDAAKTQVLRKKLDQFRLRHVTLSIEPVSDSTTSDDSGADSSTDE